MSVEDVKLCCRRTPSLLEFIGGKANKLKAEREAGKEGSGVRGSCRGKEDKKKKDGYS